MMHSVWEHVGRRKIYMPCMAEQSAKAKVEAPYRAPRPINQYYRERDIVAAHLATVGAKLPQRHPLPAPIAAFFRGDPSGDPP
jgi:hypothetical protein